MPVARETLKRLRGDQRVGDPGLEPGTSSLSGERAWRRLWVGSGDQQVERPLRVTLDG